MNIRVWKIKTILFKKIMKMKIMMKQNFATTGNKT